MAISKYLALVGGRFKEVLATVTSSGAADDGKIVALDASGRLDSSVLPVGLGADTKTITTSEALSAGDLVNVWNNVGSVRVRKADGSAAGKEATGFVLSAFGSGAAATVYFEGTITGLGGLTAGTRMYLSDSTPGAVTDTPPVGANKVVQYVGIATSTTEIAFEATDGVILA